MSFSIKMFSIDVKWKGRQNEKCVRFNEISHERQTNIFLSKSEEDDS